MRLMTCLCPAMSSGLAPPLPSSRPKITIQGLLSDLRKARAERGAMVYAINYESMDEDGSIKRERELEPPATVGEGVEARANQRSDVLNKG